MANTSINFGTTVNLAEAGDLLLHCGQDNIFFLQGEPGVGKSWLIAYLEKLLGTAYHYAYLDGASLFEGDTGVPFPNHADKVTEFYASVNFGMHLGKPVVIMIDEWSKMPQSIQNMLHPLLEVRKRRIGTTMLPEGSIVFLTGNLGSDGVGDAIKSHTLNRVSRVVVRKPNADEWLAWAVNNDIDPIVMAWVNQFPHALSSYLEGDQDSNPYIYNPKKPQTSYVSPRSLERLSHLVKKRELISANALLAGMIGTVGESGARDIGAYVEYQDQLPSWGAVQADPKKAKLPNAPGACAVMVFGAVTKVDAKTINPWMEYMSRMEPEWQAVFAISIAKNPDKQAVAFTSKAFRDWVLKNEDIL